MFRSSAARNRNPPELMAGEAGKPRTVLLATEKAFAAEAVTKIDDIFKAAGNYTLKKLENYKSKDEFLAAAADADAMIIRSDIVDADIIEKAEKTKIIVRAGAGYDNIDLKDPPDITPEKNTSH